MGRQTLKKRLRSGSRKKTARRVIPTKSAKQTSRWRREILQIILINHVEWFSVPTFCDSFWKSWRESPSSWRCFAVPWTWNPFYYLTQWKLHGVWFSKGSELLHWFKTDVLGFWTKLKLVRGCGYETYNSKEVKKEHEEEAKAEEEETAKEDAPVPLVTHVNNILHSIFSNVELYINNQQIYNSNGLYAHKSYISRNFKGPYLNTREFYFARDTTMKFFWMNF